MKIFEKCRRTYKTCKNHFSRLHVKSAGTQMCRKRNECHPAVPAYLETVWSTKSTEVTSKAPISSKIITEAKPFPFLLDSCLSLLRPIFKIILVLQLKVKIITGFTAGLHLRTLTWQRGPGWLKSDLVRSKFALDCSVPEAIPTEFHWP